MLEKLRQVAEKYFREERGEILAKAEREAANAEKRESERKGDMDAEIMETVEREINASGKEYTKRAEEAEWDALVQSPEPQ